ncbi:hypothetical protein [Rahnella aceris]|uniref:Apea-like HEPN domain-containing protein n=1 Tax=Rahnella sp. (strain Y9602) TaxID=2703885 RepID=A0ABW6CGQ7_RAHSY
MVENTDFCYPNKIDFFGTTLFNVCHFTEHDLQDYKSYNKYTEGNFEVNNSELNASLSNDLNHNEESHHVDIYDSYAHEFNIFQNIYPPIHRKTMLIAISNFCEKQIEIMCIELNKLLPDCMIDDRWPGNDAISSYRRFLVNNAGFEFNNLDKHWQYFQAIKSIRNIFCHSEGEIDLDKTKVSKKIRAFCQRYPHIRVHNNHIIIEERCIDEIIAALILFFKMLAKEVFDFMRRYEAVNGRFEIDLPPGASRTPI